MKTAIHPSAFNLHPARCVIPALTGSEKSRSIGRYEDSRMFADCKEDMIYQMTDLWKVNILFMVPTVLLVIITHLPLRPPA